MRRTLRIVVFALAVRLLSAGVAWIANLTFPPAQPSTVTMFGRPSAFWDPFTRYDAGWYYQVARYGYLFVPGGPSAGVGKAGKIAYFPVYPLLMRAAARPFADRAAAYYLAGIAVSWVAFALALVALFHVARLDLDDRGAMWTVYLTAVFPFSFFFGVVYTESVFLLFTLLTFLAFRTRRWALGAICGAVTTATRVNGILMVPALAWIAWRRAQSPRERLIALAAAGLTGAGLAAYSTYVYSISGNPFEWAVSISRWGYHPGGSPWLAPITLVQRLATHPYRYLTTDPMAPYDTLYGVTGIVFLVATPIVWWRLGMAYGVFMALNLWLPLSSGVFEGVGRYCSVLFPFFVWLGSFRSRALLAGLLVGFALLYVASLACFSTLRPLF